MVEINLLPQQYRQQSAPDAWKYGTVAVLTASLVAMGIGWALTNQNVRQLQGQIDAEQGTITALTPQKQVHDQLVADQQNLEKVTSVAQNLRDNKTYWSNDLALFSREIAAGSGVSLTKLTMKDKSANELSSDQAGGVYVGKQVRREMTLTGQAASQQAVINFLNTFENNPGFGVNFQGMQQDDQTKNYTFTAKVGLVDETTQANTQTGQGSSGLNTVPVSQGAPAAPAAPAAPTGGN